MRHISLTLKITIAFILASIATLSFLYLVFYNLFEERILQAEKEKATLIAQTIEPMIGMNYYLGLNDEIVHLSEQTIKHPYILSMRIIIKGQELHFLPYDEEIEHIHIVYPVKDPVTKLPIGTIDISYMLDDFFQAFDDIKSKIIDYLALFAVGFLLFALFIRHLLHPLEQIANKVKNYQLGADIEFSSIRTEPEIKAISDAFKKMLSNIREYTILLERYKYAVDVSAIVSKTDLEGNITYVNDEFCRVSKYKREELIGQPHSIIRHPDMKNETFRSLWQTLNEQKVWKGIVKNRTKDDGAYYVETTIVPIFDENGKTLEYMSIRHDITQIITQQEQIIRQTTDPITGLPNRIKLEEDLFEIREPKLALISLENFHILKDYYGTDMDMDTLHDIVNILQSHPLADGVKTYRLEVNEFGLLFGDDMERSLFEKVCMELLQKIEDYVIYIDKISFSLQAVAGLSYSQQNIFSNATLALYHAQKVRKSLVIYEDTENLIEYYENNLSWTKELKHAINDDRIVVFVQPIADAKSLNINKYECLVRMVDKNGNIIPPLEFLDIAKKSKLYTSITKRVIYLAFYNFSRLPDKTFSINLSLEDLVDEETMQYLIEMIGKYDIASRLILEIVESEGIENFEEIIPLFKRLKDLGCRLAIDDFGTGYSNFSYLMQLNVDFIKIDGSLIKSIDYDKTSQIITQTILDFAQQLGLETIAEYVHNEKVMVYTQKIGIDHLQGYYLGKPEPIENLFKNSEKVLSN